MNTAKTSRDKTVKQIRVSDLAKNFIDDVLKVNNEFGMLNDTSDTTYNLAVIAATRAVDWVEELQNEKGIQIEGKFSAA